jgi:two-component system OmpR family response regulator
MVEEGRSELRPSSATGGCRRALTGERRLDGDAPRKTGQVDNRRVKVLVVEDEKQAAETLRWGLAEAGIPADVVHNGTDAIERARGNGYDAVILDVMLPDGPDGFAVCRSLREMHVTSWVIMLTALSAIPDRVSGLDSGADDYLTKPYAFAELLARIRALSRRESGMRDTTLSDLVIDEMARVAAVSGVPMSLTRKEFDLLALLAQHAGRVVTDEQLVDRAWSYESMPNSGLVDVYMSRLRTKLSRAGSGVRVLSVRGIGYRLEVAGV